MVWKKIKEDLPKKFKKEWSTRQVMLTAFWDCHSLAYVKFGPDAHKEKQNVPQHTYFDV